MVEDYIEGETRLKEFKYFIHEISPSRSELRIVPQNISNELYLNEFYDMQRTNKRINTGNSVIGFEPATDGDNLGTDTDPSVYTSKTIKVQNVDSGTDPLSDGFLFDRILKSESYKKIKKNNFSKNFWFILSFATKFIPF